MSQQREESIGGKPALFRLRLSGGAKAFRSRSQATMMLMVVVVMMMVMVVMLTSGMIRMMGTCMVRMTGTM